MQSEVTDNFTVARVAQAANNVLVQILRKESHRTVSQHCLASACMQAERLVIRATVVNIPRTVGRTTLWIVIVVDDVLGIRGSHVRRP